jgi:capsid portal protein
MTKRIPMKGGGEYDGLTKARRFHIWKSGQLKKIKRAYNKRFRKHIKEIKNDGPY